MQEHAYRLFEIGHDGHVLSRFDLVNCLNDDEARLFAKRLADDHLLELWDGACLIERFEPPH